MNAVVAVLWQVIVPIFLVAGAGYILARRVGLSPKQLSRATFYVFSPCLVFDKLSHTVLSASELGQLAAVVVLTMAGSALLAWGIGKIRGYDRALTSAFVLVAFAGNTGNYGLPANQFAFGQQALEPAVVYYAISTLFISTVGVYLAASGRRTAGQALRNLLNVPLIYAGLAGVLIWITGWQIPTPIERATSLAGQAAVPVMLLLLGVQLAGVRQRDNLEAISLASLTKLVGSVLLAVVFTAALGLSGLARQSAILSSAMPTAVITTVLATEYDSATEFTVGAVLASTLASLVTVTLIISFLR